MKIRIARILIIIPTLWYGFIPPIVDFSESHVFHQDWTGHARFHMVWLLTSNFLLCITALIFLFKNIPNKIIGTRIAGLISLSVYLGFFFSAFTMNLYKGSLSDSNGMDPIMGIDGNLLVFSPLTLFVIIGLYLSFNIKNES